MKKEIIYFILLLLPTHYIHGWKTESAKNFCRLILDGEGIEYEEEDFYQFSSAQIVSTQVMEIVKRYADMYKNIYTMNGDIEKAEEMNKVLFNCNQMLNTSHAFHNVFGDMFSNKGMDDKPEKEITIKQGESIRFKNGAGSGLSHETFGNLLKATFPEEQDEKPFTIHFNDNVPEELRDEVLRRVSAIYEEVSSEMQNGRAM